MASLRTWEIAAGLLGNRRGPPAGRKTRESGRILNDQAKTARELLAEATQWLLELRDTPEGSPVLAEFEHWLQASPEHRTAWASVNQAWDFLGSAKPVYQNRVWEARRDPDGSKIISDRAGQPRANRRWHRKPVAAGVAAIAALCLVWVTAPAVMLAVEAEYRTRAGETRTVRIEDGSTIALGGATALAVEIDARQRQVSLLAGEIFIDVTRDEERPFIVETGDVTVTVLGTAFDVSRSSSRTTVALLRGSVAATVQDDKGSEVMLTPGQQLVFDHAQGSIRVEDIPLEDIGAWRDGKIALSDVTIGEAVELVQRYHKAWISVPDATLANRKVSGLFDLSDPDKALMAIVGAYGGKVRVVTPMLRVVSRL